MTAGIEPFAAIVRRNCDIADARHAQEMTLCHYLLAMREYFRWDRRIAPGEPTDRAAVGAWIAEREARWDGLATASFEPLPLSRAPGDAFDEPAANAELEAAGWVYGASRGPQGRPHFFLGRRVAAYDREGLQVIEVGEEVARDILAAPAALQGRTIRLRLDAFERWLWTSAEGWEGARSEGPMRAALEAYGWRHDRQRAIARMASEQRETLLLHEIGEYRAGRVLGAGWDAWFGELTDPQSERIARAVRDLLADCLVTLPCLLDRRDANSLHFWFATLGGLRSALFPRLRRAYASASPAGAWTALAEACARGADHWLEAARRLPGEHPPAPAEQAALRLRLD